MVIMNNNESYWTQPPAFQDLKTFSNKLIKTIGVVKTTVNCNDWLATNVNARAKKMVTDL